MNCADLEILLCDYQDGTLRSEDRVRVELHLSSCEDCAGLAAEVAGALAFLERVAPLEPPVELLTQILHHMPASKAAALGQPSWWKRLFGNWVGGALETLWQPRYAMGMAMTILSFSMIARFSGIQPRQLRPADLNPVKVWAAADDRAHRMWDRGVKYYENLRWVIETQARLKEWTDQEQQLQKTAAQASKGQKANGGDLHVQKPQGEPGAK